MFDIGFSELLLFGVIALIVLGPEKLPQAARTAGQWYAKIRRTVSTLQSEIEAELDLAETRQQMQQELAKIRQTEAEMKREMAEMRGSLREFEYSQNQGLTGQDKATKDPTTSQDIANDPALTPSNHPTPAAFDYAYEQDQPINSELSDDSLSAKIASTDKVTVSTDSAALRPAFITRPWENMWFRLGEYDKLRRLPAAPFLPDYKADILLSSSLDNSSFLNDKEMKQ